MVRRQRWCDLQLLLDDLEERGTIRFTDPTDDGIDDEWG